MSIEKNFGIDQESKIKPKFEDFKEIEERLLKKTGLEMDAEHFKKLQDKAQKEFEAMDQGKAYDLESITKFIKHANFMKRYLDRLDRLDAEMKAEKGKTEFEKFKEIEERLKNIKPMESTLKDLQRLWDKAEKEFEARDQHKAYDEHVITEYEFYAHLAKQYIYSVDNLNQKT